VRNPEKVLDGVLWFFAVKHGVCCVFWVFLAKAKFIFYTIPVAQTLLSFLIVGILMKKNIIFFTGRVVDESLIFIYLQKYFL